MKKSIKAIMVLAVLFGLCSCDNMMHNQKVDEKPMVSSWMAAGTTGI